MATTGNRDNDTPVQPQSERDKRHFDREGVRFPVELASRQPFDDFPQQSGVSRTNRIVSLYKVKRQDGSTETENRLYLSDLNSVLPLTST